jgi:hypothetical protein
LSISKCDGFEIAAVLILDPSILLPQARFEMALPSRMATSADWPPGVRRKNRTSHSAFSGHSVMNVELTQYSGPDCAIGRGDG